jgi:hypothetical protein
VRWRALRSTAGFYADEYWWRELTDDERKKRNTDERFELVPSHRRYYPPDVTAASLFLRNRIPDKWRDEQKTTVQVLKSPDELWATPVTSLLFGSQDDRSV